MSKQWGPEDEIDIGQQVLLLFVSLIGFCFVAAVVGCVIGV